MNKDCTDHCKQRRLALLANMPTAFNSTRAMAILDLKDFNTFDDYLLQVKRKYSGNTYRDACKAKKLGFYCKLFVRDNYIYDIWQINTSKSIRQGEMRAPYLYSLDELGGLSQTEKLFTPPYCNLHTDYWFGIFERSEGYKQGGEGLETGEKLIGYILLERHGEFAHLRHILGHGDYLKYGIMYFLFFELVKWVYCTLPGLFYISYAGWTELVGQIDSRPGLTMWKKKALFQPRYLMETLNLSRQELLQEINEKTEKRPFPEYTLVNAKSGLCMYSVALYGQRDVIHLYNHGLEDVTLVDIDEEKMLEMKKYIQKIGSI
ncbi:hypothetical protein [Legionella oakridgensis]|nr:hypothetical protein [Legionella oakridgensis]